MVGFSPGVLPTFYTAKQVGAMLHMRPDSVVRKIRRRQWKGVKRGNLWLIERAAVEELLRELRGQS
jgi:Helix-turn-helix domain